MQSQAFSLVRALNVGRVGKSDTEETAAGLQLDVAGLRVDSRRASRLEMRVEDAGSSFFTSVIECFAPCKADPSNNASGILSGGKYEGDWGKRYRGSAIGSIQDAIARGEKPGGYNTDSGTEKFGSKKKPLDKNYAGPLEVQPQTLHPYYCP